jgi:hypothetical protein
MEFTRRQLLAGVGLGAAGVGSAAFRRPQPQYTNYTYASSGDFDDRQLRIAWYEQYNGVFQENHNGTAEGFDETLDPDTAPAYVTEATFVTDASGPVIQLSGLMPGDSGLLVVGVEAVADTSLLSDPLDVWLRTTITADGEGSLVEPEQTAGDTTALDGELDDELLVEVWRDGSPLGTCDGQRDVGETVAVPRAPVSVAFGPGSDAASTTGVRVIDSLSPGESRCLGLAWEYPFDTATNRSQGDTVGFDVVFGAVPTGADSPFGNTTASASLAQMTGEEIGAVEKAGTVEKNGAAERNGAAEEGVDGR